MPRHKRARKVCHGTPDRRTFTLQLYDGAAPPADFEDEAKYLDTLAKRIDALLSRAGTGATTIRHDAQTFNCYVGSHPQDKVLIVKRRFSSALKWSSTGAANWTIEVANQWLKVSGYPSLDGNDPPRPVETSDGTADHSLATPPSVIKDPWDGF